MKKLVLVLIPFILMLTACGGFNNGTSMDAAKTFMQAMSDGDQKAINKIDHSDEFSFPADYVLKIANNDGIIGVKVDNMKFKQVDNRTVSVSFKTSEGKDKTMKVVLDKEKDGWYFVNLQ